MQQCNCNQCGASIEVADGINFVTCRNCQTSLKIHRTEYVVYTEVVENQITNFQNPKIELQNEAQLLYQKLNALNEDWKNKYPDYNYVNGYSVPLGIVSAKDARQNRVIIAAMLIFFSFIGLVAGVSVVLISNLSLGLGIIFPSIFFIFVGIAVIFTKDNQYVKDRKIYEQKQAAIEKKIAELEQKLSQL